MGRGELNIMCYIVSGKGKSKSEGNLAECGDMVVFENGLRGPW